MTLLLLIPAAKSIPINDQNTKPAKLSRDLLKKRSKKIITIIAPAATKIIEGFLRMPQHHQAMLNTFLEKAPGGDEEANRLTRDYAAGKMIKVELWEEMRRRHGSEESNELIAECMSA